MSQIERQIRRLNGLLAAELGTTPSGAPLYRWLWAAALMHPSRVIDKDTNRPAVNYRCACGLNKTIHDPNCRSLVIPEPIFAVRPLLPRMKQQYVICKWCAPLSREEWAREFGSQLEYPAQGYLFPVGGPRGGVIALGPGEVPDAEATWEFIHMLRKQRTKTFADHMAEVEAALDRQEKADESELDDKIADACTAFGHAEPGTRSGGISLPTKEFRKNADLTTA